MDNQRNEDEPEIDLEDPIGLWFMEQAEAERQILEGH
jgi:hypothetical protein